MLGGTRALVSALVGDGRRRLAGVLVIQVAAALGQAFGVLLLIPLLSAIGLGAGRGVSHLTRSMFHAVGLRPTLAVVLTVYVAVTGLSSALSAYQNVLSTRFKLRFLNRLRGRLYAAIAAAEWRHLIGIRRSDMLAVLNVNIGMVGGGVGAVLGIVVAAIVVGAQSAVALQISVPMTGLSVLSGLLLALVVWPLVRRSKRLGTELVRLNKESVRLASQFMDALKLAKAYGREREHEVAYLGAVYEAQDAQVAFAWANGLASAVQQILTACLLGLTVYVAIRVAHVPVGSLLVVAVIFTKLVSWITAAQSNVQQLAQALPAWEELAELTAACEAAGEPLGQRHRHVRMGDGVVLDDVRFAYPSRRGRDEALRGISLELPRGATVALTGPSGAGKTTVSDIVAGLLTPTGGCMLIDGRPIGRDDLCAWRQRVALVPQEPFLFHDTVEANLRWAKPDATKTEIWEALATAQAAEFVRRLDEGAETVVGDRGTRLSGGERQRLALARAILRDADLLILDEATSSLDTENELAIKEAIASLHGRQTILLIAHRLSTIADADEVVVLDRGEVSERGTWPELARGYGRFQALLAAGATV